MTHTECYFAIATPPPPQRYFAIMTLNVNLRVPKFIALWCHWWIVFLIYRIIFLLVCNYYISMCIFLHLSYGYFKRHFYRQISRKKSELQLLFKSQMVRNDCCCWVRFLIHLLWNDTSVPVTGLVRLWLPKSVKSSSQPGVWNVYRPNVNWPKNVKTNTTKTSKPSPHQI